MFLVRQSLPQDVSALAKLARTVFFINLPPNDRLIAERVEQSQRSFRKLGKLALGKLAQPARSKKREAAEAEVASEVVVTSASAGTPASTQAMPAKPPSGKGGTSAYAHRSDMFMFSVLDLTSEGTSGAAGAVVGTSQLMSHMGGPGDPNWGMRVREKKFYNKSLRFGTTHTVGQLEGDESGPTELGGLILDPGFRGHKLRPGRLISFIRFHLIGLYREMFADRVLAEMSGPVSTDGDNAFWDAFGRKFVPVKYGEADRFCQHNRDFIFDLLPKEEIYLTLLPMEVVNAVGVVGPETRPAQKLLENMGFAYKGVVDPFDGGPHMEAVTNEISLVKATRRVALGKALGAPKGAKGVHQRAIVSVINRDGEFSAVECDAELARDGSSLRIEQAAMDVLSVQAGSVVGVTPLPERKPAVPAATSAKAGENTTHAGSGAARGVVSRKKTAKRATRVKA